MLSEKGRKLYERCLKAHSRGVTGLKSRTISALWEAGLIDSATNMPMDVAIRHQIETGEILNHRGIGAGIVRELCNYLEPWEEEEEE